MKNLLPFAFILLFSQCQRAQNVDISNDLQKKWETPAEFQIPESVKADPGGKWFYVANISGNPSQHDNSGFISRISSEGKIMDLHWVDGLDAPKGMGIYHDHLFVSDIDKIVEIDIATAAVVNRYSVDGAVFLNDIDVDDNGCVYVSDSRAGKIYRLRNGKPELWLHGGNLEGSNGICYRNGQLYIGTGNSILVADTGKATCSVFASGTGPIDGLEAASQDEFLYSDWSGSVFRIRKNQDKQLLLNTSEAKMNAADIEYLPDRRWILVPTFSDNRVITYELK